MGVIPAKVSHSEPNLRVLLHPGERNYRGLWKHSTTDFSFNKRFDVNRMGLETESTELLSALLVSGEDAKLLCYLARRKNPLIDLLKS